MNPGMGFQSKDDKMTPVSIPSWVSRYRVPLSPALTHRIQKPLHPNIFIAEKSQVFIPSYIRQSKNTMTNWLLTFGESMAKRIGTAKVVIKEIEPAGNTPLKAKWQGIIELGGTDEDFISERDNLEEGNAYHVVYERTETITGEPVIEIHEII